MKVTFGLKLYCSCVYTGSIIYWVCSLAQKVKDFIARALFKKYVLLRLQLLYKGTIQLQEMLY